MRSVLVGCLALVTALALPACQGKVALAGDGGGDSGTLGTDAGGGDAGQGNRDAGGGTDAGGSTDAGGVDAGTADSGTTDAGAIDSGTSDSGTTDAGFIGNDVLQHHAHLNRDGVYTDPYLTPAAIPTMHVDTSFNATTGSGLTFAQPLYMANGVGGVPTIFVATENNDVYALDASTGAQLWTVNLGPPVPKADMQCGIIDPMGVTGTPVIDSSSRMIFLPAMVLTGAATPHHMVYALHVDDHSQAWVLDVGATISGFPTTAEGQRSALTFLNGTVYVPYGGLFGDCGNYHGYVVAIPAAAPTTATAWSTNTSSYGSGIWGPAGIASDGTSLFVSTGNSTSMPTVWLNADSEAVIRLGAGSPPTFSAMPQDYFAPRGASGDEWHVDDVNDADVGSSGVAILDVAGANPSHLALAVGKAANVYLLDRDALGGIDGGLQLSSSTLFTTNGEVNGAMFSYTTQNGSYFGMCQAVNQGCSGGDMSVLKVSAAAPPQLSFGWCANSGSGAQCSPIVSQTAASQNVVVWTYGSQGDETLRAYDGDNGGTALYTSPALPASVHWNAPIVAGGRVYVAGYVPDGGSAIAGVVTALTVH